MVVSTGLLLFAAAPDPDGQPVSQWSALSFWSQLYRDLSTVLGAASQKFKQTIHTCHGSQLLVLLHPNYRLLIQKQKTLSL